MKPNLENNQLASYHRSWHNPGLYADVGTFAWALGHGLAHLAQVYAERAWPGRPLPVFSGHAIQAPDGTADVFVGAERSVSNDVVSYDWGFGVKVTCLGGERVARLDFVQLPFPMLGKGMEEALRQTLEPVAAQFGARMELSPTLSRSRVNPPHFSALVYLTAHMEAAVRAWLPQAEVNAHGVAEAGVLAFVADIDGRGYPVALIHLPVKGDRSLNLSIGMPEGLPPDSRKLFNLIGDFAAGAKALGCLPCVDEGAMGIPLVSQVGIVPIRFRHMPLPMRDAIDHILNVHCGRPTVEHIERAMRGLAWSDGSAS